MALFRAFVFQNLMSQTCRTDVSSTAPVTATYYFKLVLLGEAAVGKSCLVVRFAKNMFLGQQEPTIGGTFYGDYPC